MTTKEQLMYKILGQISSTNTPIIFKGGLITKLILEEQGFIELQRATKDIDANWIGKPPTMTSLLDTINSSLGELGDLYTAKINREYGLNKSAGISIIEKNTGDKIISMDIDMKPLIGSKIYYLGETSIKGVLANEIIADKLCAISSDAVYKHRAKDIVDVYALSQCSDINTKEIFEVCTKANRIIQNFDAFLNRKNDVEHAYLKLRGIDGKPDFDVIYKYLSHFITPFIEKNQINQYWNTSKIAWQNEPIKKVECNYHKNEKKFSPLSTNLINHNAKAIKKQSSKHKNTFDKAKGQSIE
jgi:hypothetical protein